jgi:hypothetical protein
MFSLMLGPRFKTLRLVSSLIGCEQGKAIVEKYDKKSLFPMHFKCHVICILWLNLKRIFLVKELKRTTI